MIPFSKPFLIFMLLQFTFGQLRFASSQSTSKAMETHGVVPDVIDIAPAAAIKVKKCIFFLKLLINNCMF